MSFSENHFKKPLDQVEYIDVQQYFNQDRTEGLTIEYKSYATGNEGFEKRLGGVIRTICGFLNSEGGMIIWGAPSGIKTANSKERVFKGDLEPVPVKKEKDWIVNKVSDSISPLPTGISIRILTQNDEHIYIFEVEPSLKPPHQAKHIYWARLDGQTKPLPHYLVEALFKMERKPDLEGFIKLNEVRVMSSFVHLYVSVFIFNFSKATNEHNVSFRLLCPQGRFNRSDNTLGNKLSYAHSGAELVFQNFAEVIYFGNPHYHDDIIILNRDKLLREFNDKIDLSLSFGGKFSLFKSSHYEIDLSKYKSDEQNLNELFTSIEENKSAVEIQEGLGTTKEKTLRTLLSR
jgi:hypothetical protein